MSKKFQFDSDDEDEKLDKELNEVLSKNPRTTTDMNDEEYARKLSEALNEDSPSSSKSKKPEKIVHSHSGTFAQIPGQRSVSLETFDSAPVVTPTPEYSHFNELKKMSFTIKILCGIDFIFSLYVLVSRIWWLSFGIVFAPIGGYGAHRLNSKLVLIYLVYLFVNVILELVFTFLRRQTLVIVLSVLIILIQSFIAYHVIFFFRKLPENNTGIFYLYLNNINSAFQRQLSNADFSPL